MKREIIPFFNMLLAMRNIMLGTNQNDIWDVDHWLFKGFETAAIQMSTGRVPWKQFTRQLPGMDKFWKWQPTEVTADPRAAFIQSSYLLDISLWHCHWPVWGLTDRRLLLLSAFQGLGPAYLLPDGAQKKLAVRNLRQWRASGRGETFKTVSSLELKSKGHD